MKKLYTILLSIALLPISVMAQLINANFEQGLLGWISPCAEQATLSTDAPPNGGQYSLQIRARTGGEGSCIEPDGGPSFLTNFAYQLLPMAVAGDQITFTATTKLLVEVPDAFGHGIRCDFLAVLADGSMTQLTNMMTDLGIHTTWQSSTIPYTVPVLPAGATLAVALSGYFMTNGQGYALFDNLMTSITGTGAVLNAKVWLEGPYAAAQGLMRDDLRAAGYIPSTDPYPNNPIAGSIAPGALSVTGPNAIVDWLRIELRHTLSTTGWQIRVNGLLQRDGDIVALDGVSPVSFPVKAGNYQLVVRHRNHLTIMTEQAVSISSTSPLVDLRSTSTALNVRPAPFNDLPARVVGNQQFMWQGNTNTDLEVAYTGVLNDRDGVLGAVGGSVPTNTITGYHFTDVNMDGVVKYIGPNNDRDPLLQTIGGVTPTAVRRAQVPY